MHIDWFQVLYEHLAQLILFEVNGPFKVFGDSENAAFSFYHF